MTIAITDMVDRAARELEDSAFGRWSQSNWVDYINSAIKEVCRLKPDAYTVRENVQLANGNIQSLPTDAYRLIRPTRNMGLDGIEAGNVVHFVKLDPQNSFDDTWYTQEDGTAVDDVLYDEQHPLEFWVSPPAPSYYIEIICSKIPSVVTISSNLPLIDFYETPVIYFAKGFAHQANRNDVDFSRSQAYMDLGFSSLGIQKSNEREIDNG